MHTRALTATPHTHNRTNAHVCTLIGTPAGILLCIILKEFAELLVRDCNIHLRVAYDLKHCDGEV